MEAPLLLLLTSSITNHYLEVIAFVKLLTLNVDRPWINAIIFVSEEQCGNIIIQLKDKFLAMPGTASATTRVSLIK